MILDQRHLIGSWPTPSTPAEVAQVWTLIAKLGFAPTQPGVLWEPRELTETSETVDAYISDNRWVADCPACRSGVVCWPEHDRACCFGCFRVYRVKFPPKRQRERAVELLDARPPGNRHWLPHRGETVKSLAAENAAHGDEIEAHAKLAASLPEGTLEAIHHQGR